MSAGRSGIDLRWGVRMAALDNASKVLEPLLTLACASTYAGGAWGSFKLAESMAYLLFRTSMLGLDRGIVWWFGQVDDDRYRKDLASSLGAVLLASIAGAAILAGTSLLATGRIQGMAIPFPQTLMVAAAVPLLALSEVLYQANLNQKDMFARILGKNVVLPAVTFGGALLGHALRGPGLPFWFLAGCATNFATAVVSFSVLHRSAWAGLRPGIPDRKLIGFSLPLTGSDLLDGLTRRIDIMLLGSLADIRAVEIYNVVTMIGRSLQAIRESFDGLLLSSFSRKGTRRMDDGLRTRLNQSSWAIGSLMGIAVMAILYWGRPLLSLLDKEYASGYPSLIAMAAFTYLNVFGDLSGIMLQGLGLSRSWGMAQVVGFGLNVACNLALVPRFGALGGVLALKCAALAQGTVNQLLLRRHEGRSMWMPEYLANSATFAAILALASLPVVLEAPLQIRLPVFAVSAALWLALFENGRQRFRERTGEG